MSWAGSQHGITCVDEARQPPVSAFSAAGSADPVQAGHGLSAAALQRSGLLAASCAAAPVAAA